MTLNDRYRIHNKRKSKKFLMSYFLILAIFVVSITLARYVSSSSSSAYVTIAKWSLKINNTEITQDTDTISNTIDLVAVDPETNTPLEDELIRVGQSGYFDITINPQYTEVALTYDIVIDPSELPSGIVLTEYSTDTENNYDLKNVMPENKTLTGDILLDGRNSLTDTDVITYRVFWEWQSYDINSTEVPDYKVKTNVKVQQLLNGVENI